MLLLFCWVPLAAFTACADDPESQSDADGRIQVATLVPELSFGDLGADRDHAFQTILSVSITTEGVIWVLDGRGSAAIGESPRLRLYDMDGAFMRQVGREGDGPGEYRAPHVLGLMEDGRVAARDSRFPGRITLYNGDGSLQSVWSVGNHPWGFSPGTGLEVDDHGIVWLPFTERRRPGPNERGLLYLRVHSDGSVIDTVAPPPHEEVERDQVRIERRLPGGGISIRGWRVPFQPYGLSSWMPHGGFALARTDRYRVEILPPVAAPGVLPAVAGLMARRRRVVAREVPSIPVSDDERRSRRARLTEQVRAEEGGQNIHIPDIPTHKQRITYLDHTDDGRLIVGVSTPSRLEDGEWVEDTAFEVFDDSGRLEVRVVLPEPFRMHGMRDDLLWGVWTGAFDVESVRVYRIEWPEDMG